MRAMVTAILATFACAMAANGCSSSTSSVSADQACADATTAYCAKLNECAPFYVSAGFVDVAACASRTKTSCVTGLSANGTGATAAQAESCAQAIPALSCGDVLSDNTPSTCKPQPGTLADGTACGEDSQCTGAYCKLSANSTCGACGTKAAPGATCNVDNDCQSGNKCNASNVCVAIGGVGTTCDPNHPCRADLACKGGSCATADAAGTTCASAPDSCDHLHGDFCNPTTKVCEAIQTAPAGGDCGVVNGTFVACTAGGFCKVGAAFKGTCVAPAADGQACDTVNGPQCLSPAICAGGVCKLPDPSACK